MEFDAKKIIKKIEVLPDSEKEKIYSFILQERSKDLSSEAKKLIKFGIQSVRKLQKWNKAGEQNLIKSRKFLNGLKTKV